MKRNFMVLVLSLILMVAFAMPVSAYSGYHHPIRVNIGSASAASVEITYGTYQTLDSSGNILSTVNQGSTIALGENVTLSSVNGYGRFKVNSREYRGDLAIKNGVLVNTVGQEEYLYAVVMTELGGYCPDSEALKAQAVASRSFSTIKIKSPRSDDYDILSSGDQVYRGYTAENYDSAIGARVRAAVNDTKDIIAYYNGSVANTVFCCNCGGETEDVENVWGGAYDYLKGVEAHWDALPFTCDTGTYKSLKMPTGYEWVYSISASDLGKKITTVGTIKEITIDRTDCFSGYAKKVTVVGSSGSVTYTGTKFRSLLGLRSANFNVETGYTVAASKALTLDYITGDDFTSDFTLTGSYFTFSGKGYGHSVGMSQWSACVMAEEGYTYDEILKHFYTGITLAQW